MDSRVERFDAGGDDYLTKPFAFVELSTRVNALGRRREDGSSSESEQMVLRYGDLSLDLLSRKCERQGKAIDLMSN